MEKKESPAYWAMLGLSLAFSILAVVTLIPGASAKPNVLGYHSVCSFAPAATALCGFLAGITCTLRNRLVSRRASSMRYRPLFIPAGVGLVLLLVAAVFGIRSATVEVTVKSGRIESVRLVSGKNVDSGLAQTVFSRVKETGSTAVDAVSGATASSNVLLKAIAAAAAAP